MRARTFLVFCLLACACSIFISPRASAFEISKTLKLNADVIYGELRPSDFTTLAAELAARIIKISVRDGESFKKGQIIIALDCALLNARLDRANAIYLGAQQKQAIEKRLHELNSTGRLEFDLAIASAAKAEAELKAAKVSVSKCIIKAPYDGRVVALKARPYQFAQVGMAIMEILNGANLEVEFIVPSRRLGEFEVGAKLIYRVNENARDYPAHVSRRGAMIDPVSQSIHIVGQIDGTYDELIPGMSGSIHCLSD